MSGNATDANPHAKPRLNTDFYIKSVDYSNPDAHAYGNVQFIAPRNSVLHIDLNSGYHTIAFRDNDGAFRNRTNYGHYFRVTDSDGNIIATGVISGINFDTCTIGVNANFPSPPAPAEHNITRPESNDL